MLSPYGFQSAGDLRALNQRYGKAARGGCARNLVFEGLSDCMEGSCGVHILAKAGDLVC